jgi:4'-phosphopantetheinyl transferase
MASDSFACEWGVAPDRFALEGDRVDLWKIALDKSDLEVCLLYRDLGRDEVARADRFHFDRDRRRFIAAHGQLRRILARYIEVPAREIEFSQRSNGKPFVNAKHGGERLDFNLSHSGELALVAIAAGREVGVDVERVRALDDADDLAARYFTSRENARLRSLPSHERIEGFFRCWTLKEAFIKATGEGLARPLDSIDIDMDQACGSRLLIVNEQQEAIGWALLSLTPEPGYVGAVAVEGDCWIMRCWFD